MNRHFDAFNLHQVRTPSLHEKTVDEKSLLRREMFLTFLQKKQHMCCNPIVKVNIIKKLTEASRDKSFVCAKLAEIFAPCFVEQYQARLASRPRVLVPESDPRWHSSSNFYHQVALQYQIIPPGGSLVPKSISSVPSIVNCINLM